MLCQNKKNSKYYAIKTVWFREGIIAKGVKVVAIETRLQLGDIFTKMPGLATFVFLRELLLGWWPIVRLRGSVKCVRTRINQVFLV